MRTRRNLQEDDGHLERRMGPRGNLQEDGGGLEQLMGTRRNIGRRRWKFGATNGNKEELDQRHCG